MKPLPAFRAGVDAVRAGRAEFPYGHELRRLAVEHAREVVDSGGSLRSAAEALGVNINSLRSWRDSAETALVPVVVTDAPAAGGLVVFGPAGLRIEGLSLGELAELLRLLA